ncbi:MAG: GNAT family N-acetyltransferase, partial [Sphingomonadales bacterium]
MITLLPLDRIDPHAVESLLDRAFGADRRARTAYALRDGLDPVGELSFAALEGDRLVGTIQCWPVTLQCDAGDLVALTMVGPVAVEPESQQGGIGRTL